MSGRTDLAEGWVTAAHGQRGILETPDGEAIGYLIKGKRLRVVCGDRVTWRRETAEDTAILEGISNRTNALQRISPGRNDTEILAANLTCVVVVFAPAPTPDWFLIDRYLCGGALMNCKLLLVANKSDLIESQPSRAMPMEVDDYRAAGYECLSVSAKKNENLDALGDRLSDEVGVLVGQSGVGKSSIINRMAPDAQTAVRALSKSTSEGTHTTSASIMHRLACGGRLIDSPGVREFIPAIDDRKSVQSGFPEIWKLSGDCRFHNCQHLREPNCAVKQAVETGSVSARRYESYKRLLSNIKE